MNTQGKLTVFLLTMIVVAAGFSLLVSGLEEKARGYSILTVGEGRDHRTIKSALENASDGDLILISAGTYLEQIIIGKSLTIKGEGMDRTGIRSQSCGITVLVNADNCSISGLAIIGNEGTDACMSLNSSGNTVSGCLFKNGRTAVHVGSGDGNTIMDNIMIYNGDPDRSEVEGDLSKGLVAYYKMDEGNWTGLSGEVKDSSGNGLDGRSMKGAGTLDEGIFGSAGHFDGEDDYVELEDYEDLDFGTGPFSVSVWIKMDDNCPEEIGNKIVQKRGGRDKSWGQITGWMMAVERLGTGVYVKNTGVDDGAGNSIELANRQYVGQVDTWIHLVLTWDTSTASLHVNGGERYYTRSNLAIGNISNERKATIGCHWNNGSFQDQFFHGMIDEVKIYNRLLNTSEIGSLYEGTETIGAVLLEGSNGNLVYNNTISYNNAAGVLIAASDENIIMNNTLKRNTGYGVLLDGGSVGNFVFLNDFGHNCGGQVQAYDAGSNNSWDHSGSGNYWSDWTTPDADNDLIVDDPYQIDGPAKAQDNYPLIPYVKVVEENTPPLIVKNEAPSAYEGEPYSFIFEAFDRETPSVDLEWMIYTNASWLSIDRNWIHGTPESTEIGEYWVHVSVYDGELSDHLNTTLRVLSIPEYPDEGEWSRQEFHVEDLFPPMGDSDPQYSVEDNEDVDLRVNEDGTIEICQLTEWSGYRDVIIEQSVEGDIRSRNIKLLKIGDEGASNIMDIRFESGDDQFLVAYINPDLDLVRPLTYSLIIEDMGIMSNSSFLNIDLPDGRHLLDIMTVDAEGRSTGSSYMLIVGDDEGGGDIFLAITYGIPVFSSVLILILLMAIIFGLIIRKRNSRMGHTIISIEDRGIKNTGAIPWEGRRGPSPLESIEGGPHEPLMSDGLVKGGALDTEPKTLTYDRGIRNASSSFSAKHIRKQAILWEGADDMGMTDDQVMEALEKRFYDGEMSQKIFLDIRSRLGRR